MILLLNTFLIFGLTVTLFIGLISFVMADSDEEYLQLKRIYDEQRWNLEKEFKEKFKQSSIQFKEQKQEIYEKSESDSTLTVEQTNQMLRNAFYEFLDRQEEIKTEYTSKVDALNEMFTKKFEQFENKIPLWVKKVIELWDEGKISDIEFVNFLSFLINNDIITVNQLDFLKYDSKIVQLINVAK